MSPEQQVDKDQIFHAAAEIEDPADRAAYLDEACGGESALRAEIEELLRHDLDAGSFLEQPAPGLTPTIATGAGDTVDESLREVSLEFLEPSDKPTCLGTLAHYEVLEVVGRGGMGLVLRAYDPKLNRVVAIKVMPPELAANPMAVKRFLREARAAAAVSHDHVVTIHAIEEARRPPFIVMEFVDGQSLQEKVDDEGALPLQEILRIGMQTARGLAAAHEQGLVHRDIKPANILLENGVERVKITDFGLARAVDDVSVTQTGQIAGTPQFMSPEQALGQAVDVRSDLFSLGSLLYTMCTGRPPFRAETAVAMLRRVVDDTPRRIREVNADVPDWLEAIIFKLLAKDPGQRFESAAEVADLLGRHLAHLQHPTTAPLPAPVAPPVAEVVHREPATPAEPVEALAPRAARRRFGPFAAIAVLAAFVALAVAGGIVYYIQTDRGTVRVEILDPEVKVTLRGDEDFEIQERDVTLRVRAGENSLHIRRGDLEFDTESFALRRGEQVVIRVTRVAGTLEVRAGDVVIGRRPLPVPADATAPQLTEMLRFEGHEKYVLCVDFSPNGQRLVSGCGIPERRVVEWDARNGKMGREYKGHNASLHVVRYSPNGRYIASGGKDSVIALLRPWTLEEVHRFEGHTSWINCLEFSPDSRRLASGSNDNNNTNGDAAVRVWDVEARKELWHQDVPRKSNGKGRVAGLAYSPDGTYLLTAHASPDERLTIWNAETGQLVRRFGSEGTFVRCVAWSPDGRYIATGHEAIFVDKNQWHDPENCVIRLYDPATGRVVRKLEGHTAAIDTLDFSPDGRLLVSGSGGQYLNDDIYEKAGGDNSIRIWDVASGRQLLKQDIPKAVKCATFSPDGKKLATAAGAVGEKPELVLWRLPEFDLQQPNALSADELAAGWKLLFDGKSTDRWRPVRSDEKQRPVWTIEDGWLTGKPRSHLVSVDTFEEFELSFEWKVGAGGNGGVYYRIPPAVVPGDTATTVNSFVVTAPEYSILDNATVQDGANPRTACGSVWGTLPVGRDASKPAGEVNTTRIICRGDRVEHWLNGQLVVSYDVGSDAWKQALEAHRRRARGAIRQPSLNVAAAAPGHIALQALSGRVWYRNIKIRRLGNRIREVRRFEGNHLQPIKSVAVSPEGRFLLSASYDRTVRLWNIESGKEVRAFLGHTLALSSVGFSPDGLRAVSGGSDGIIRIWNVTTGNVIHELKGHTGWVRTVAFSPDGTRVVSGSAQYGAVPEGHDRSLRLWDAKTGEQLFQFEGETQSINAAVFTPDGRFVLTAGEWNRVALWDVEKQQLLRPFAIPENHALSVAVSPDGKIAATGQRSRPPQDGGKFFDPEYSVVCLWDIATGRLIRKLHGHSGPVNAVAFSPDGRYVLSGSGGQHHTEGYLAAEDNTLRLWDVETGAELYRAETGTCINAVAFTPDGQFVVSGGGELNLAGGDNKPDLRLWRLPEGVWPPDDAS